MPMPGQYSSGLYFPWPAEKWTEEPARARSSTFFSSGDGGGSVWCCCGGCWLSCVCWKMLFCVIFFFFFCAVMFYDRRIYTTSSHLSPKGRRVVNKTHISPSFVIETLLLLGQGRDPLLALLHLLPFKSFWGFLSFYDGLTHIGKRERGDMTLYISIPVCVCVWRILYGRRRHLSLSIVFCVCATSGLLQSVFFFKRDDPQNNKTI